MSKCNPNVLLNRKVGSSLYLPTDPGSGLVINYKGDRTISGTNALVLGRRAHDVDSA